MKLGEIFIERGILTNQQLEKALSAQLIYGGHLGTCLIEMGLVEEIQLGEVLSDVFQVPFADNDRFQNIPAAVIKSIPLKLVQKLSAVPFERTKNQLSVALVDPKNLPGIDEISFVTGCKIVTWVAPEVRIAQALERYYGIPRRLRYITVCNAIDSRKKAATSPTEKSSAAPRTDRQPSDEPQVAVLETPLLPMDPSTVDIRPEGQTRPDLSIQWSGGGGESDWDPEKGICDLLCGADCADAAIEATLDFAARGLERCMFLTVKSTTAVVRSWRRFGFDRETARRLSFSVTDEPIFQLFVGDGYYRGPLPVGRQYLEFYAKMQVEPPSEMLVIPVYLDDRLVAVLYGDGGVRGWVHGEAEDYRRLVRKLAVALNITILKNKLRSV
jgi:hypothetical protein